MRDAPDTCDARVFAVSACHTARPDFQLEAGAEIGASSAPCIWTRALVARGGLVNEYTSQRLEKIGSENVRGPPNWGPRGHQIKEWVI